MSAQSTCRHCGEPIERNGDDRWRHEDGWVHCLAETVASPVQE